ncbi:hypothetical protein [Bradyrhizobium lupini]|uniref:hypothetical protein n=1 Tax=Rhizobium lupini TaxID=136996 RepID=UPI0036732620
MVTSRATQTKLAARSHAHNETGWLLAVAAAFLIVHAAAWTICGHVSSNEGAHSQPEPICLSCD